MQDTKRFEDQHPAAGPELSGALGSLRKGGVKEQGGSKRLLEALHADMWTGMVKKNAVGLLVRGLSLMASRGLDRV
jgi:hypothetical protein